MPIKVSSDHVSYTLTYLTLKCERNRIFHPCRVMFDFYRQALLKPQHISKKISLLPFYVIQSPISLSLEVQPCIKNELTFRTRRHHRLVRKIGSKLTVKPGTKRQISLHRGTTRVTSVSPNTKLTPSPVNQVLYRSNFCRKSRAGRIQV